MRISDISSVTRINSYKIDPRELKVTPGYNVRDLSTPRAIEKLEELKKEIREAGGVLVPLEVRLIDNDIHIVSGHRRHRAVMELIAEGMDIKSVPATLEQRGVNDAERLVRLKLHNDVEQLTALELAELVRRLINMGWSREQIADRFGYKTAQSIANLELLLAAPERLREALRQGQIAPSTVMELVRQYGDKAAEKMDEINEAAERRGKARGSLKDISKGPGARSSSTNSTPSTSTGNASPMSVEERNKARLAAFQDQQEKDIRALEDAVELLNDLSKRNKPEAMADMLRGKGLVFSPSAAAKWLDEFCSSIVRRELV
jgi:ParB/RepB/Spo0J family partition protein